MDKKQKIISIIRMQLILNKTRIKKVLRINNQVKLIHLMERRMMMSQVIVFNHDLSLLITRIVEVNLINQL